MARTVKVNIRYEKVVLQWCVWNNTNSKGALFVWHLHDLLSQARKIVPNMKIFWRKKVKTGQDSRVGNWEAFSEKKTIHSNHQWKMSSLLSLWNTTENLGSSKKCTSACIIDVESSLSFWTKNNSNKYWDLTFTRTLLIFPFCLQLHLTLTSETFV